jgi:hypothetical protein
MAALGLTGAAQGRNGQEGSSYLSASLIPSIGCSLPLTSLRLLGKKHSKRHPSPTRPTVQIPLFKASRSSEALSAAYDASHTTVP